MCGSDGDGKGVVVVELTAKTHPFSASAISWRPTIIWQLSLSKRSPTIPYRTTTMTRLRSSAGLSNAITYLLLALFALPTQALYFYMEGGTPKCFHEELPKDTLVVGMLRSYTRPCWKHTPTTRITLSIIVTLRSYSRDLTC